MLEDIKTLVWKERRELAGQQDSLREKDHLQWRNYFITQQMLKKFYSNVTVMFGFVNKMFLLLCIWFCL